MTYCNALKFFSSAPFATSDIANRLRTLLACLGNPERRLRIITVAGEKGKSSVVRMIASMIAASGMNTVSVIYPCLASPKDNVFVGNTPLSIEEFVTHTAVLSAAVRKAGDGLGVSEAFAQEELLFCLALCAAAESGAKWLVLEIPNLPFSPLSAVRFSSILTVITSCGENVRPSITAMINPDLPETVSARQTHTSAHKAIFDACTRAGCRLTIPHLTYLSIAESSLRRTVFTYRNKVYSIPLYGDYALANTLCALEAAEALRRHECPITEQGKAVGLASAVLPARAEILSVSPTVLVDAASDAFSEKALCELLKKKGPSIGDRITLCISENAELPEIFFSLSESGFRIEGTVRVPRGKENRTASLLLKAATGGDLILAVGPFPFVFTMRTEFLKVLKSM